MSLTEQVNWTMHDHASRAIASGKYTSGELQLGGHPSNDMDLALPPEVTRQRQRNLTIQLRI